MANKKRIYLAGPMTGIKDYNFPAFMKAAEKLRSQGHYVFNPAENDLLRYGDDFLKFPELYDPRKTFGDDLRWICEYGDAIALMPGWEKSKGVAIELALSECLGLEVIFLEKD
jgi:hypothetical protein